MDSDFSFGQVTLLRIAAVIVVFFAALVASLGIAGRWTWGIGATGQGPGERPSVGLSMSGGEIYRRSVDSVVKISAADVDAADYAQGRVRDGTGFVVDDDGHIVTCAHVVSPTGEAVSRVRVVVRRGEAGESSLGGAVVGVDAVTDLAIVRVDPRQLRASPLPLGRQRDIAVGDVVYCIGHALDYDFSMTEGIVSALHRVLTGPGDVTIRDAIQTDAAVNVGGSGGPLLDSTGAVIGVNERIATPVGTPIAGGNVGLAFAVPVDTVRDVLRQLERNDRIVRPWIGVEALTITPVAVQLLDLKVDRGLLLVDVTADGPAAAAGLCGGDRMVSVPGQPGRTVKAGGDVITALAGREVSSTDDLVDCVQALRPGDRLPVKYVRDGRPLETVLVVGTRPAQL